MIRTNDTTTTGKAENNGQTGDSGGYDPERFRRYRLAQLLGTRLAQQDFEDFLAQEDNGNDGWTPVDLGPYVRDEIVVPEPSVGLTRSDGLALAYPAHEHVVVAETSAGKSWAAGAMAVAEAHKGNRVLYIHYEETNPAVTVERLKLLGATADEIMDLIDFVGPRRAIRRGQLEKLLDPVPSLVIHDGINQAMALLESEHFGVGGAANFRVQMVVPCLDAGATTWGCDHFPMGVSGKRVEAYGSVHKGNVMDGPRYMLENVEPFGRGMRGRSNLYLTKDRPGYLMRHGSPNPKVPNKIFFGSMIVDATPRIGDPGHFEFELIAPTEESTAEAHRHTTAQEGGGADLTLLREALVSVVERHDRVPSQRDLFARLRASGEGFTDEDMRNALAAELADEHPRIRVEQRGRANVYRRVVNASE
jgi:hypothetical protein